MPKRNRQKRKNGRLRSRRIYILCAAALFLLVTAAFMMPQMVLLLHDNQVRDVIHLGTRSELKYAAADIEYEMDMYNRMKSFAEGCAQGRQYFIASSDYSGSENDDELREKALLQQEWYWYMVDMGFRNGLMKEFLNEINILKKEYLVIYDNDPDNGASFVCWYLQFEQSTGTNDDMQDNKIKINLLMDAKDNTIYYLDLYYDSPVNTVTNIYRNGVNEYIYNYFLYYFASDMNFNEELSESASSTYANQLESVIVADTGIEKQLYYDDNSLTLRLKLIEDDEGHMLGFHMGVQELLDLLPAEKRVVQ